MSRVYSCPIEVTIDVIGGKWKPLILQHLMLDERRRFNELRRLLPNVTQQMLTLQLRELEHHGIISRTIYAEVPPRVEYAITDLGRSILPVMMMMLEWGDAYLKQQPIPQADPAPVV